MALEKVFGRHTAVIRTISGVYRSEAGSSDAIDRVLAATAAFDEPRAAVRGSWSPRWARTATTAARRSSSPRFADLGFDVDVGPLFSTPEEVARQAVDADVHIVGVSSLAAGHLTLVPQLQDALADLGRPDIMIVVGGVIPPADVPELLQAGAAAVFGPGTIIADSAADLLDRLAARS